ncbi:malate dehydrogenase [Ornithinicoccus hortensis]|uniref:Malate dehydrogenase (NAD) n=1 Tax=Ornithinicoccus hortensis TaxID=82346 RepID=A0A542YTC8_9MICO|nr:malate dehydrogenase [Ornithinicoccus hortensis]TQL51352.1 malate dehydrogenase (NAD) [Ornithinicoccus hortensis]
MALRSVRDVEAASDGVLHLAPGDVVTPLARERAADLGVRLVHGGAVSAPPPAAPRADHPGGPAKGSGGLQTPPAPVGTPSNALLRRGAPVPVGLRGSGSLRGGRALVVGAGHVGQITALRLAEADSFDEIVLADVAPGLAAGIALDLTHTSALGHFATTVRGVEAVADAGTCDYVVITAGKPRQPGMSRSDLISTNAEIVGAVARDVARTSPQAVIVVVTNPLDEMTHHAWVTSGFPAERVMGMAGVLDTARFQALAALEGAGRADRIKGFALGSHGDEMSIPLSQSTVGNQALSDLVPAERVAAVVDRTRSSGAEVVGLLKSGSAFLAPGTSAAHMVLAMKHETGQVLSASVRPNGEYGLEGVHVGLPVRLGPGGVDQIIELPLSTTEVTELQAAAARIRDRLGDLESSSAR